MKKPVAAIGSAIFFVLASGTVVVLLPWLLTGWETGEVPGWWWLARALGALLTLSGAAVVVDAFVRFVVEGRGTPAPVAPPEHLVVGGLYRYVRNPMYVGVLAAILGQALWLGRWELLAYAAVAWGATATFVRGYEEPTLTRLFGTEYAEYRKNVPAWIPRLQPWTPGTPSKRKP